MLTFTRSPPIIRWCILNLKLFLLAILVIFVFVFGVILILRWFLPHALLRFTWFLTQRFVHARSIGVTTRYFLLLVLDLLPLLLLLLQLFLPAESPILLLLNLLPLIVFFVRSSIPYGKLRRWFFVLSFYYHTKVVTAILLTTTIWFSRDLEVLSWVIISWDYG